MLVAMMTLYRLVGNFQRVLFSDISKNIASTKIKLIENKCVTSFHQLTLQQYENKTSKFNLSMILQKFLVRK